jgi:hypothetical protein
MLGSGIPDCVAGSTARQSRMARFWLTLLDDVLTWLNPLLGCVAAMLTILVLQAADEHFAGKRMNANAPAVVREKIVSAVERRDAGLPREWKELRLYD